MTHREPTRPAFTMPDRTTTQGLVETLNFRIDLAEHVAQVLKDHRVTTADAATLAGISEPTMQRRLMGFAPFTIDELRLLTERLGLSSVTDLLPPSAFIV